MGVRVVFAASGDVFRLAESHMWFYVSERLVSLVSGRQLHGNSRHKIIIVDG
jgi:hypothetical protein